MEEFNLSGGKSNVNTLELCKKSVLNVETFTPINSFPYDSVKGYGEMTKEEKKKVKETFRETATNNKKETLKISFDRETNKIKFDADFILNNLEKFNRIRFSNGWLVSCFIVSGSYMSFLIPDSIIEKPKSSKKQWKI